VKPERVGLGTPAADEPGTRVALGVEAELRRWPSSGRGSKPAAAGRAAREEIGLLQLKREGGEDWVTDMWAPCDGG